MKLFLDDLRQPIEVFEMTKLPIYKEKDWTIVRTYQEFVAIIEQFGMPVFISFDHDLGQKSVHANGSEASGYDCAKWLVNYCLDKNYTLPHWFCHSMNPVGKQNITELLTAFGKRM